MKSPHLIDQHACNSTIPRPSTNPTPGTNGREGCSRWLPEQQTSRSFSERQTYPCRTATLARDKIAQSGAHRQNNRNIAPLFTAQE
jgi:hypothetical protein